MNWKEIYLKYKDTELMKQFAGYILDYRPNKAIWYLGEEDMEIKDIWGHLIVFAEVKGWILTMKKVAVVEKEGQFGKYGLIGHFKLLGYYTDNPERSMLWCTDKFFEVAK